MQALDIAPGPDRRGTVVTMTFGPVRPPAAAPGLETLCALALETVADVSCVDLVHDGVLRRVAAEVADDPALTSWLRAAVPPAKPGTATWSALREGGARVVVHDPTVPRSPGGTGERLDLTWWIAVPLEKSDGTPAALWGLGGREGGHAVPPEEVMLILGDAAARRPRAACRARHPARSAGDRVPIGFSADHPRLRAPAAEPGPSDTRALVAWS